MTDIHRTSTTYMLQSWGLILLTTAVLWGVMLTREWGQMLAPILVGLVFSLVVETADAQVWKLVALKSPDSLPQFYTSASAFRMLLALMTMAGYYLATERGMMGAFLLVFGCFYVVMLCHHSVFFARVANRQ